MLTACSVCSVTLGSLWLGQVEKDQNSFRVVEVVQVTLADAFCRCSILGFSIAGKIQVFTSADAYQGVKKALGHKSAE